jgi:Hypothetical glycosyl hydrolase 6/Beta-galactosidase trimerisation domain
MNLSSRCLLFLNGLLATALTAVAQSSPNPSSPTVDRSRANYDWILHRNCSIHMTIRDVDCRNFDVEAMAKEFERLHVDFFTFFAAGYVTTYPTKLEFERLSPWLGGRDLAGDIISAAHRHGIKVVPAIDLGMLPESAFKAHPEWASVDASGKPVLRTEGLYAACILGGYVQEYSREMIAELLTRYDVDGMKFGGSSYGFTRDPCYCAACRKAYAEASGKEIPTARDWNSPEWREFIRWRTAQTARVVQHLVDIVHSIRPGMPVVGNSTDFGDPGWTLSSSLDIERLTEIQGAPQVEVQSRAKNAQPQATAEWQYLRWPAETTRHLTSVSDKPIWVVASYFYAWPWRRVAVPVAEQKVYLAQIAAHGGNPMVNLSGGPPAVHEDKRGFRAMEELYGFIRKHRDLYEGDKSAAEVALVYDHDTLMFYGNDDADTRVVQEFRGIEEALDRAHVPFDIISTRTLTPQTLARYRALVLPNAAWLGDEAETALENHVKHGGGLVATYQSGQFDYDGHRRNVSKLADLLGVRFQGDPKPVIGEQRGVVQAYAKKSLDHPVLAGLRETELLPLSGLFCPVTTQAPAKVVLARTAPFQTFPEGWSYPQEKDPDDPILIVNQNPGAGRTAYFAPQIGRAFWQSRFPDLATLIRDTVQWAANTEPPLRIVGPPTLHTSLRRSGDRFMVHCINLTGGERLFSELVPLHGIRVSLRCDGRTRVRRAWRASDGRKLRIEKQGTYATTQLDRLTDYDVVVFEMGK